MTSTSTRIVAGLAALATAALLSSCSGKTDEKSAPAPSTTASAQVAAHNAHDVMFAQMMIPHHQQALELSPLKQPEYCDTLAAAQKAWETSFAG